jgi:hypothetical protein
LDDIFIYSDTIEQHEDDLEYVLTCLRREELYIAKHKFDVYSERMDCLGHVIDEKGLHADLDKMARIRDWHSPRSFKEVEQFLGLVQYLQNFMPDVSAYTSPLSGMCANGRPFVWRSFHEKCLESIKAIACRAPILRPINPKLDLPIWVIADASTSGIGAYLGQGKDWETCHPAGFMSKKFTIAQRSYFTYEQETLALLEALLKWEDKLLGCPINLVTDHKSLEFFKTKDHRANRQIRWSQYFERFNCTITYVEGPRNKVADCLSRYYSEDTFDDLRKDNEYMSADIRLDPDGDDLPIARYLEVGRPRPGFPQLRVLHRVTQLKPKQRSALPIDLRRSGRIRKPSQRVKDARVKDAPEPRQVDAAELAVHQEVLPEQPASSNYVPADENNPLAISAGVSGPNLHDSIRASTRSLSAPALSVPASVNAPSTQTSRVTTAGQLAHSNAPPGLPEERANLAFDDSLRNEYKRDKFFAKILDKAPEHSPLFSIDESGLIKTRNHAGTQVICIPNAFFKGRRMREIIIDHAHIILDIRHRSVLRSMCVDGTGGPGWARRS